MMPQPIINSIHDVYQAGSIEDEGFNIYMDIQDLPEVGNSYRWESTYYTYKSLCFEIYNCCEPCWNVYKKPTSIAISEDRYYNGKSNTTKVFKVPYETRATAFVNIELLGMNPSGYDFWNQLNKQISNVGSIFDPIPSSITGNVSCISKPNEKVYGCFIVASYSITSYYVKRDYITKNPNFIEQAPIRPSNNCKPCIESSTVTKIKPFGWK
jgi:hypothetical protein